MIKYHPSFYKFINDIAKKHHEMLGKSEEYKTVPWRQIIKELLKASYK